MENSSRFDTLNSDEIIAQAVRNLKHFIEKRVEVVANTKFTEPKKDDEKGKLEYNQNIAHKAGYIQALSDIKTYIHTIGI